jgi:hypothetical protein
MNWRRITTGVAPTALRRPISPPPIADRLFLFSAQHGRSIAGDSENRLRETQCSAVNQMCIHPEREKIFLASERAGGVTC